MNDSEILHKLKEICSKWNFSPEAALKHLDCELKDYHLRMMPVNPVRGPFPYRVDEIKLNTYLPDDIPDWVQELFPDLHQAKLEKHYFSNGRKIAKFVIRGRVIHAAELMEPEMLSPHH